MSERATVLFEDALELDFNGQECGMSPESLSGYVQLLADLCHVQSARAAGEVGRICAELVFGYHRHPSWDATCDSCIQAPGLHSYGPARCAQPRATQSTRTRSHGQT